MPLMVSNYAKYQKNQMSLFSAIYKKSWFFPSAPPTFAPFPPFLGQIGIFPEKWHHHLKRLMVFYLYAKKYKKRLNGSKDIIWKIERSDWSGAFMNKSREWEFSQIWDLCRKLANHNTLHFRSFQEKSNDSILRRSPKSPFLPIFGPFLP